MICFGGWGAGGGCLGEVCVGFVSASCRLRVTYVGFVQIGIPAMSTTEYSLRGCWGFIPPFGRGLPNYHFQIPFQRRYGGYRFSRQGITSHRMDIFPLPDGHFPPSRRTFSHLPVGNTGWLGSKNTLQTINVKLAFHI